VAALVSWKGWVWATLAFAAVWIIRYVASESVARPRDDALGARPDRVRATWLWTIVPLIFLTAADAYYARHQQPSMDDIMRSQLALFRSGAFDAGK